MKIVNGTGQYANPQGQAVSYSYEFEQFDNLDDAVVVLGEAVVLKNVQRMVKIDANNTARENAKVKNGHSSRKAMTEEQKSEAKAKRQTDKALLDALRAKGISNLEDLALL